MTARWLQCEARRKPAAPLAPIVDLRLRGIRKEHRPLDYEFYRFVLDYITRTKNAKKPPPMQIRLNVGGGGLSFGWKRDE